ADGMESAECNGGTQYSGWKARDGKLLFACLKSVVVVDPNHLPRNELVPQIAIESVKINQQENVAPKVTISGGADEAREVIISGGADVLEFHYASLSYFAPKRVRFKCKLEGFDDWSFPTTPGFVRYTNVPPGHYRFRVL